MQMTPGEHEAATQMLRRMALRIGARSARLVRAGAGDAARGAGAFLRALARTDGAGDEATCGVCRLLRERESMRRWLRAYRAAQPAEVGQ